MAIYLVSVPVVLVHQPNKVGIIGYPILLLRKRLPVFVLKKSQKLILLRRVISDY
jgi:hypothetical protein